MSASFEQVWRFQTGQNQQIKASPILANGILYVTTPDNIWAVDARTAKELWHYQNPPNNAFHIGHRGAAIYKDTVYLTTPDCHLIALNAKDGTVKWDVVIADSNKGYWSTNAPLVVGNHVLVGVSGDFDNLPGQLKSVDADTGKTQWIFYSTPPPGAKEPNSGGATGGQMWTTGTYDPDLNLVYVGTGNPTPVLNGEVRPGDNPWTCSIVALNPDTGKLVWGFQASPHDTHDWDANEVPVLVDANFNGQPRKLLMQASRNGYFFVLDRTNGNSLLTAPFATVNWAKGIDAEGHPIPDPAKYPSKSGVLVAPNESGATNFRPPSFDPEDRPVHRERSGRLRNLFLQIRARGLRLGRRGLWRRGQGVPSGHRLPDRKDCLEPSDRRRRRHGWRANDGYRPDVQRRRYRQRDGLPHQRRRHAMAREHRQDGQRSDCV